MELAVNSRLSTKEKNNTHARQQVQRSSRSPSNGVQLPLTTIQTNCGDTVKKP